MNDEIFDVVNEQDEVVGQRRRAEVHQHGLLHRAVHVMVFNASGQVFLQKRSRNKDRQPGVWDSSASGHVDSGEDYDTCAQRELKEEINLHIGEPLQRLFKLNACPETDGEFVWVYQTHADGPFTLNAHEIDDGEWFDVKAVTQWMAERPQDFASALIYLWPRLLAALQQPH